MRRSLEKLQPIGRALMLPIAVLPAAGLLLRLGQPDMLDVAFIAAAGNAVFAQLGLLFAIGVAVGLARGSNGTAGLAGAVAYLVTVESAKALIAAPAAVGDAFADSAARELAVTAWKAAELTKLSVPAGILSGLAAGWLYNRFAGIKLPEYLAFFGGKRFVPIAAGAVGLAGGLLFGLGFPLLERAVDELTYQVAGAGAFGLFLYGVINRLLLVTGLHHILNNIAWFILGDFQNATGDLQRFFAGDPSAGAFMSGFYPVMMFGLPAACLAMYHSASPARRKAVGGMLLSLALTSFLTGVTEPIEFSFLFLAPTLYALHAVLTGIAMVTMNLLDVRLGFGFSAGLIDYLLNYGLAARPLLLWPIGFLYAAIYYGVFRFCIVRFDLKTPGRDDAAATAEPAAIAAGNRAAAMLAALGGPANLIKVDACTTRLRLAVHNTTVDEPALRALGAHGFVRPGPNALQVVLGPEADRVAEEIRAAMAANTARIVSAGSTDVLLAALGGRANIASAVVRGNRLCAKLHAAGLVDAEALQRLPGIRGLATPTPYSVQIIADPAMQWPPELAAGPHQHLIHE